MTSSLSLSGPERPTPWLLCALMATGLVQWACGGSSADESTGRTELKVVRGEFSERILLTGELVAEDAVTLVTPNANQWPMQIRWLAEDGIEVAAGDVVVEFDNSQLASNLESLRTRVVEAENQLLSLSSRLANDQSQAAYDVAQKKAELDKARLDAKIPPEIQARVEYERFQLEVRRKELQLAEAEHKLETVVGAGAAELRIQEIAFEQAQREMTQAEDTISRLSLHAPRAGILLVGEDPQQGRPFQSGDSTFPGNPVARIPDLATMMVEAHLFDVDDGRVLAGQQVLATLDSFPHQVLVGQVREVEGIAQSQANSQRRVFRVLVDLETIDQERMRPGMSVKLHIASASQRDVLLLPRLALRWQNGKPGVRRSNGEIAVVELGPCNATECVVLSGLDEGDTLAPGTRRGDR